MADERQDGEKQGAIRRWLDDLPLGAAPMLIGAMALISGLWLLAVPVQRQISDMTMWVFAVAHQEAYRKAAVDFEKTDETSVSVDLVHFSAINQRLRSAMWSAVNIPDLVEVEKGYAGSFFRGPVDQVGFVDLKPWLERDGLMERIPANALATYTNRGRIFGVPHDIHPVFIAYRADLMEPLLAERGLTIDDLDTWEKFNAFGRSIVKPNERYLLQIEDGSSFSFDIFFLQRGGNYFSPDGELTMNSEIAVETLLHMVPMIAGEERIGANLGSWGGAFYKGMIDGYYLAALCPDWRSRGFEEQSEDLAGKMKLMPLPAVTAGGLRTSQYGGTMLGITKASKRPEAAWAFVKRTYYGDPAAHGEMFRSTNILTPDRAAWGAEAYHEPRPYWSGQVIGELFIEQAPQVPAYYSSAFLPLALTKMGEVVVSCCTYYRANGAAGFEEHARAELAAAEDYVRKQMAREPVWDAE